MANGERTPGFGSFGSPGTPIGEQHQSFVQSQMGLVYPSMGESPRTGGGLGGDAGEVERLTESSGKLVENLKQLKKLFGEISSTDKFVKVIEKTREGVVGLREEVDELGLAVASVGQGPGGGKRLFSSGATFSGKTASAAPAQMPTVSGIPTNTASQLPAGYYDALIAGQQGPQRTPNGGHQPDGGGGGPLQALWGRIGGVRGAAQIGVGAGLVRTAQWAGRQREPIEMFDRISMMRAATGQGQWGIPGNQSLWQMARQRGAMGIEDVSGAMTTLAPFMAGPGGAQTYAGVARTAAMAPGVGVQNVAGLQAGLQQPETLNRLMSFGINARPGGQPQSPEQVIRQIAAQTFGGQAPTPGQVGRGMAPGMPLYQNLSMFMGDIGSNPEMTQLVSQVLGGQAQGENLSESIMRRRGTAIDRDTQAYEAHYRTLRTTNDRMGDLNEKLSDLLETVPLLEEAFGTVAGWMSDFGGAINSLTSFILGGLLLGGGPGGGGGGGGGGRGSRGRGPRGRMRGGRAGLIAGAVGLAGGGYLLGRSSSRTEAEPTAGESAAHLGSHVASGALAGSWFGWPGAAAGATVGATTGLVSESRRTGLSAEEHMENVRSITGHSGLAGSQGDGPGSTLTREYGAGEGGSGRGPSTANKLIEMVKSTGIPFTVTSKVRPGAKTRSGNLSYHATGHAIDISSKKMKELSLEIARRYGKGLEELIYTPGANLRKGKPHTYGPGVKKDHYDHIHVAATVESLSRAGGIDLGPMGEVSMSTVMAEGAQETADTVGALSSTGSHEEADVLAAIFGGMGLTDGAPGSPQSTGMNQNTSDQDFGMPSAAGWSGGSMDPAQIAKVAYQAGFRGNSLITAVAIAMGESSGNPGAVGDESLANAKWGPSIGLWQVRSLRAQRGTGKERDVTKLMNPNFNARSAYSISGGGKNFQPWTVYNKGIYKKYLAQARSAVMGQQSQSGPQQGDGPGDAVSFSAEFGPGAMPTPGSPPGRGRAGGGGGRPIYHFEIGRLSLMDGGEEEAERFVGMVVDKLEAKSREQTVGVR